MASDQSSRLPPPRTSWRGWAVADVLYGLAIVAVFVRWVPWRTPACNVVALLYGAGHLALVPWLVRGNRAALRVAFGLSLLGVLLGLVALAGLLFSWAYLRVSFGSFGAGASVVCLLLAVVVANVCGLYPALRLAALARRWKGQDLTGGGPPAFCSSVGSTRSLAILLVLALPAVALGATAIDISLRGRLATRRPWSRMESTSLFGALAQEGGPSATSPKVGACEASLGRASRADAEDWRLSAFAHGERLWSKRQDGQPDELCRTLGGAPAQAGGASFWLLERVAGRALLPGHASPWLTLGLVPGLEGAEGMSRRDGFTAVEAVAEARFGVAPILPALAEVRFGLDAGWAAARLPADEPWSRVRWESWLWAPGASAAWPVVGGRALRDVALTQEELAEASRRAAQYLVRVQSADGRFRYQVDLRTGSAADPFDDAGYNLARHAGTTAALGSWAAQQGAHAAPVDVSVAVAAVRGADWLLSQRPAGGFVSWGPEEARLGDNALALVALLAAARASDEARGRLEAEARLLAEKLQALARTDGQMVYRFDPATRAALPARRPMFEAEEAAYALILSARQLGAPAFGATARTILDELLHHKDRYFLGWFVYGADAWTCLAVEAGWPEHVPPDGLAHCRGYASFLRRMQDDGGGPFPDRRGQYGFSELLVPQTPATAGFSEAVLATWALARRLGVADEGLEEQGRRGLEALLREQTRAETAFLAREPHFVDGGYTRSSVEPEIRVDFVQHALSALMWGVSLIPPTRAATVTPPRPDA